MSWDEPFKESDAEYTLSGGTSQKLLYPLGSPIHESEWGPIPMISIKSANARIREMVKDAATVLCRRDQGRWSCDEHPGFARTTHHARLICIEELLSIKCDGDYLTMQKTLPGWPKK